jgi:ATP-binding cassette subfamily F protein 3
MDEIITQVHEIADRKLIGYTGNYSDYLQQREDRYEQQSAAYKNQQKEIQALQEFADRFRSVASKASQAMSKLKQIERMELIEKPTPPRKPFRIQIPTPPRGGQRAISLEGIHMAYGKNVVYSGLDLTVERGERTVLVGPNGAGKSTLLKIIAGVVEAQEGVRNLGHNAKLGYFSQHRADSLDPNKNVVEEVLASAPALREDEARAVLGSFMFRKEEIYKPTTVLSGGEKSRLNLIKFLVDPPNLLLMDEPLSALDKQLREHMQIELRQLHERLGMTTVYVTHDQREALTMSDRIAVIDQGRIRQIDTPKEIYERPTNRFVAEFIGESTFVTVDVDTAGCTFNGIPLALASQPARKGPFQLMIRPERLSILEQAVSAGINVLPATVTAAIYQGDSVLVHASLPDGTMVTVRASASARAPVAGEKLNLGLNAADAYLLPVEESAA